MPNADSGEWFFSYLPPAGSLEEFENDVNSLEMLLNKISENRIFYLHLLDEQN